MTPKESERYRNELLKIMSGEEKAPGNREARLKVLTKKLGASG